MSTLLRLSSTSTPDVPLMHGRRAMSAPDARCCALAPGRDMALAVRLLQNCNLLLASAMRKVYREDDTNTARNVCVVEALTRSALSFQ